jgi:hypothetical protein
VREHLVRGGWFASYGASGLLHALGLACLALVALSHFRPVESRAFMEPFVVPISTELDGIGSPVMEISASLADSWAQDGDDQFGSQTAQRDIACVEMQPALDVILGAGDAGSTRTPLGSSSGIPSEEELSESALGRKLGKGLARSGGRGMGSLREGVGEGGEGTAQFFDLESAGMKVVYVLDRSESMQARHAEARNRLERVKAELTRSVGDLASDMQFFVIFFNHNALAMPAEKMQPATLENKRKYLEWCAKMKPGGATDPRDALQRALDLKPDVIYLLTDGDFSEDVVGVLQSQNSRGVPIHTICIGNTAGERQLKEIARQHSGVYKFVQ